METWKLALALILLMSIVTFCLYGADKRRAKRRSWRIKESSLLFCGVFGGALGALFGMLHFRHKTKRGYFWAVNLAALLLQAAGLYFLLLFKTA